MIKKKIQNIDKEIILISLLIIIAIIPRLQFTHPTDYDSYWIHGMSESINKYGYANWVFNPVSLFGYYPLSYPSGLMFFLSFFSAASGLNMWSTIAITGIFFGVLGTLLMYQIGKHIAGKFVGFITALVFATSPQIIYYSSGVASGRYFLIIFALYFLIVLLKILMERQKKISNERKIGPNERKNFQFKYIVLAGILIIFAFLIHRLSQLFIIFIIGIICSYSYYYIPIIWTKLKKINIFHKFIIKRYAKEEKAIFLDIMIFIALIIGFKVVNLYLKGRLTYQITRLFGLVTKEINALSKILKINIEVIVLIGIVASILLIIIIYFSLKKKTGAILDNILSIYKHHYKEIQLNTEKYINALILTTILGLFVLQFFNMTFYSPSLEEYEEGQIFEGKTPLVIFLNTMLNYHTSISPFLILGIFGLIPLIFKHQKNTSDVFLIFVALLFSGILIDRRYVKLFVTPIIAIFIALGFEKILIWVQKSRLKIVLVRLVTCIFIFGIILTSFSPVIRYYTLNAITIFNFKNQFNAAGGYLEKIPHEFSTLTTEELDSSVQIFAASGVPGASFNVYYYVNKTYITPTSFSINELKDKLLRGDKIHTLWILNDWILGGQYYIGRHAKYVFSRPYNEPIVKRILSDYREEFYIHDKRYDANTFYKSITPVFNKIYENSLTEVYSLKKGKVLSD